jgi:aryl-alcohol dehydrogenase-like predicted oxidoreductase
VSELALGTLTFGEEWGFGAPPEECRRMFDAFAEEGGNFIDTADRYTNGSSERIVGELISSERDRFVVASKYALTRRPGDPNASGTHRKSLVAALDASLMRLGLDYLDLYLIHAWDLLTPLGEVMRALDDQVRAGKILYLGVSNAPAWVVARANALADERGLSPFVALQIEYSLIQRDAERELIPMATALDLGVMAWAPLGGGVLTGKYRTDGGTRRLAEGDERLVDHNLHIADEVGVVASEIDASRASVAIAWLLRRDAVTIPILGARSADQLRESLAGTALELSPEQVARLDAASRIELGYPHDFVQSDAVRDRAYGGTYDRTINHRPGTGGA